MKTLRYLILAVLTLGATARAAEFTDLVLDRYYEEESYRADRPSHARPDIEVKQKKSAELPADQDAEERGDRSPFSNWRNFVYTYGSPTLLTAYMTIHQGMEDDQEIDPTVVATQAIIPAAISLPADLIKEGGKRISKSLADGHDLVSPLSDTINETTASLVISQFDPKARGITKREVGESLATDIMYALPKFTLACALKEGLGWTLGWPFKRSLDTWGGVASSFVGDMLEGWAKHLVKRFIRKEIVNDWSAALFGPKDQPDEDDQPEDVQKGYMNIDQTEYYEVDGGQENTPAEKPA